MCYHVYLDLARTTAEVDTNQTTILLFPPEFASNCAAITLLNKTCHPYVTELTSELPRAAAGDPVNCTLRWKVPGRVGIQHVLSRGQAGGCYKNQSTFEALPPLRSNPSKSRILDANGHIVSSNITRRNRKHILCREQGSFRRGSKRNRPRRQRLDLRSHLRTRNSLSERCPFC